MIGFESAMLSAICSKKICGNRSSLLHVQYFESNRYNTTLPTIKYLPAHPLTIRRIAAKTLLLAESLPTTVGIVLKKQPLAAPLMNTKTISGAKQLDTRHTTSMLTTLIMSEMKRVLTGPMQSKRRPQQSLLMADEKLKPATRPALAEAERPRELLYRGKKKGGTRSGKVARTAATNSVINRTFLRKIMSVLSATMERDLGFANHAIKAVDLIGARSLISQAAGRPVAGVTRPRTRKVQVVPSFWWRASIPKLVAVPPIPPPVQVVPSAMHLFLLEYCAGMVE